MSEERTGLSSYGQQLFDALRLDVAAIIEHLVNDPEEYRRVRADVEAALADAGRPAPEPVAQVDVDALVRSNRELMDRLDRLDRAQATSVAPATAPPTPAGEGLVPSEPPPPPAPVPAPSPFEGQTPMVPHSGPTA